MLRTAVEEEPFLTKGSPTSHKLSHRNGAERERGGHVTYLLTKGILSLLEMSFGAMFRTNVFF